MKVSVLQENMKAGLALATRATGTKSYLPILSNVLIETAGDSFVRLSCTNLELYAAVLIAARVEEEGGTTVPYRLLGDLVGGLPAERIDLSIGKGLTSLHAVCMGNVSNMRIIPSSEFPTCPNPGEEQVGLPVSILLAMIDAVAFAAATNDQRPVLSGVLMRGEAEQLTMAATDGFRLSSYTRELPQPLDKPFELVIPTTALRELHRFLPVPEDDKTLAYLTYSDSHVRFTSSLLPHMLATSLLAFSYPDYQRLIPHEFADTIYVDRAELAHALRLSRVFSRRASDAVSLEIMPVEGEGQPHVLAVNAEAGLGDNCSHLPAEIQGPPMTLWISGGYLADALGALEGSPTVCLRISGQNTPLLIGAEDKPGLIQLIMPVARPQGLEA